MNNTQVGQHLGKGTLFISLLLAFIPFATAQDTSQYVVDGTVKSAVLQAIETNPDVQVRFHAFRASAYEVSTARSGYLPSVDLSASVGKANRDYDGRGAYNSNQAEISLTQMLFDGFRTSAQVNHFDSARHVRYYELLNSVEVVALAAVQAYENVARSRELVTLARENYAKHRQVLEQIEERVESGVGRRVDLEQVAGRLALAESNLLTEASNLHDATARYLRVVGDLPAPELIPADLSDTSLPADVAGALELAYQGNPGFHAAIKNIAAAQATVKVERSGYYPKAELRARQGTTLNNNGFDERVDPDRYGDQGVIELALTYNLYSGGANRSAIRRSLEEVNQAKDQRDQACVDLRQTTQVAYNDAFRINEQLISLDQHRRSSDKVRVAYSEQFNIGQRTLLDVLDAENEFFQASRTYVSGASELTIARARTLAAMGKLLPALTIVRDGLKLLGDAEVEQLRVDAASACPTDAPIALTRADLISEMTPISSDALFAVNSSELTPGSTRNLDQLLQKIKDTPKVVEIRVEGHTDNTGSDAINLPLSKSRAQRVRDYLVLNGLELANIRVDGFGSSRPVADNTTESGRAVNRRVEVTVTRQR
jgi:adhesin transport system outer membrane protein